MGPSPTCFIEELFENVAWRREVLPVKKQDFMSGSEELLLIDELIVTKKV